LVGVRDDAGEVGFWVGKPYWNRGYATAGTRRLLRFAFEERELEEVFARSLKRNDPSRHVLEKLGFTPVGVEVHEHPKWTEEDPVVRYECARSEWQAGPDDARRSLVRGCNRGLTGSGPSPSAEARC
jgi:RimJ/RimL family protein N-acetyltransferase